MMNDDPTFAEIGAWLAERDAMLKIVQISRCGVKMWSIEIIRRRNGSRSMPTVDKDLTWCLREAMRTFEATLSWGKEALQKDREANPRQA